MEEWKSTLIPAKTHIIDAIKIIDNSSMQIALIVDDNRILQGTLTDGDIRRAILKQVSLETPVRQIMCSNPKTVNSNDNPADILSVMRENDLRQIPVLNDRGCVVGLKSLMEITGKNRKNNTVVLMAGGLGSRLRPLTESKPKPLLHVGNKPVLETILENFVENVG